MGVITSLPVIDMLRPTKSFTQGSEFNKNTSKIYFYKYDCSFNILVRTNKYGPMAHRLGPSAGQTNAIDQSRFRRMSVAVISRRGQTNMGQWRIVLDHQLGEPRLLTNHASKVGL